MHESRENKFLTCDRCGGATIHSLLCVEESDVEYTDADGYSNVEPAVYRVFSCNGCRRISLYVWSHLHSPHTEVGEREYPTVKLQSGLPPSVQSAYMEAKGVKNGSDAAYAIMVRRVLEIVTLDRGIRCRNLALSLSELIKREQLPPALAEAVTLMRTFGNTAAHNKDQAINRLHTDMMERLLDALLEHIYMIPADIAMFKLLVGINDDEESF